MHRLTDQPYRPSDSSAVYEFALGTIALNRQTMVRAATGTRTGNRGRSEQVDSRAGRREQFAASIANDGSGVGYCLLISCHRYGLSGFPFWEHPSVRSLRKRNRLVRNARLGVVGQSAVAIEIPFLPIG